MDYAENESLMLVVGHDVGHQLQTLRVICNTNDNPNPPLLLDELLAACPNLSVLCLGGHSWESTG